MKNYFYNNTLAMIPPMGYDMTRTNPGSFGERARSLSNLSAGNTQAERIGSCFFYGGIITKHNKFDREEFYQLWKQ